MGNLVHRRHLEVFILLILSYIIIIHSVFCKIHYLVYNDKMTRMNGDAVYELYAFDSSFPCESFLSTAIYGQSNASIKPVLMPRFIILCLMLHDPS